MRKFLLATTVALVPLVGAHAAPLIFNGVSYTLEGQIDTVNPLIEHFALLISGENTASDTEGQRTGVNAIGFTEAKNGATASGVMDAPATGFTFAAVGIDSGGCTMNQSANFYCFDNTAIPPTPNTLLSGILKFVFDVTLKPGNTWVGYNPDLKIDWVGLKPGGYSLVSQLIDVGSGCPDCVINQQSAVPEPASIAMLGVGLLGLGFLRHRKQG
jgi:hypothetical protein